MGEFLFNEIQRFLVYIFGLLQEKSVLEIECVLMRVLVVVSFFVKFIKETGIYEDDQHSFFFNVTT